MNYTVRYKKIGGLFWSKIKNVKGDGFVEVAERDSSGKPVVTKSINVRWFMLDDETRIEVPAQNAVFEFDNNRWLSIKKAMEAEAGQTIPTNSKLG